MVTAAAGDHQGVLGLLLLLGLLLVLPRRLDRVLRSSGLAAVLVLEQYWCYYLCLFLYVVVAAAADATTLLFLAPCSVSYSLRCRIRICQHGTIHRCNRSQFLIRFRHVHPRVLLRTSSPLATSTSTLTAATNCPIFSSPRAAKYSSTRVFSPVSTDNLPLRE